MALLFFTPSYRGDLDRLVLLRASMRRFYRGHGRHVVAVPEADYGLFRRALSGDDVDLVSQQSLVDRRFFPTAFYELVARYAPTQAWRFAKQAGKGGWIIQQIAKLNSISLVESGPIAVLDSDLFFFRDFDDSDLLSKEGRLMVRMLPNTESGKHRKHIANARRLLRLPEGDTEHHYMSCPAILHSEWLHELFHYLESERGMRWQDVLLAENTLSEYSIYGIFVEELLKPSDLVIRDHSFNHMLWDEHSYAHFFADPQSAIAADSAKLCIVVQSAMKFPVADYHTRIYSILSEPIKLPIKDTYWGGDASVSGPGSDDKQTQMIRNEIPRLLREFHISSILDIPCGDFNWMKDVNLAGIGYIGADIVTELIAINQKFASSNKKFVLLNIMEDVLPDVDLILTRDCFMHFSNADVFASLKNITSSNSVFLLTTTFTNRKINGDIETGKWRAINLEVAPFNFPPPLALINEGCTEEGGIFSDKSLALWKISDIKSLI